MKKDSNLILRIDDTVKKDFGSLTSRYNVSMSAVLNALILDMLNQDKLPQSVNKYLGNHVGGKYKILSVDEIKKFVIKAIKSSENEDKITKVYLFGSYARNEATIGSDIDIRIETDNHFSLFDLSRFHKDLVEFSKKEVDVATQDPREMDPEFYSELKKDEICIYVKK